MDIDNTPSGKSIDIRVLPRLAANILIKMKWPDAVQVRYSGTVSRICFLTSVSRHFYSEVGTDKFHT